MAKRKETILVTGGAGFIGSHLVDRLIKDGYRVRVLDNLLPPAHNGKLPPWFNAHAEFLHGDVRNRKDWEKALKGVDYIFHLAAYTDIFSDFSTYFETNAAGTALMYETIMKSKFPVKKIVAASSQSVYGEGKYSCKKHGVIYPDFRSIKTLKNKQWEILCPYDNHRVTPLPEKEDDVLKPIHAYGASKAALEHALFALGKLYKIPSVALRYSIVQGAHQSFRHFYSGAIRAYIVMGLSGQAIITHEDGGQLRDFVNVHDVVDAHLTVLRDSRANYQAFNVGSGKSIPVIELARTIGKALGVPRKKIYAGGHFRWATTRHSIMDISKLKKLGWRPKRNVEESVREYVEWVKNYPEAKKFLEKTDKDMKKKGLLF